MVEKAYVQDAYLPSDPQLAGPTSICIGKPANQQDQPKTSK